MIGNINLITTIIGFGMSSTFMVFVCTRLICGRLRVAAESRRTLETESDSDVEQPEQRRDALEPVAVAAIPTLKYHRDAFGSNEDAQCSICLGEYQEKEVLRMMPKCGHTFHLSCIDLWLRKQSTCPVCRLPLKVASSPKPARLLSVSISLSNDRSPEISMEQPTGNSGIQQHHDNDQISTSRNQESDSRTESEFRG